MWSLAFCFRIKWNLILAKGLGGLAVFFEGSLLYIVGTPFTAQNIEKAWCTTKNFRMLWNFVLNGHRHGLLASLAIRALQVPTLRFWLLQDLCSPICRATNSYNIVSCEGMLRPTTPVSACACTLLWLSYLILLIAGRLKFYIHRATQCSVLLVKVFLGLRYSWEFWPASLHNRSIIFVSDWIYGFLTFIHRNNKIWSRLDMRSVLHDCFGKRM